MSEGNLIFKYDAVLFDLDRTIWDFDTNSRENVFRLLKKYSLNSFNQLDFFREYDKINHILWAKYEKGEISKEELRVNRFYDAFNIFGIDDYPFSKRFGEEYLDTMPDQNALINGSREILRELHMHGVAMAIISNGFKEVQYRKLEKANIIQYFKAVVISEEVGYHKPSPKIFQKAIDLLECNKTTTLMVGDDPLNDIEGAQIFGIDQFHYNKHGSKVSVGATYESDNLKDLLNFIRVQ